MSNAEKAPRLYAPQRRRRGAIVSYIDRQNFSVTPEYNDDSVQAPLGRVTPATVAEHATEGAL